MTASTRFLSQTICGVCSRGQRGNVRLHQRLTSRRLLLNSVLLRNTSALKRSAIGDTRGSFISGMTLDCGNILFGRFWNGS